MANVLPVLMYRPKRVILFTTPQENYCADNLEKLFKSKKIIVARKDNLNAYDYITFKEVVKKELEKHNDSVWLNVTGGTKLMALAAYEAFVEKNNNIIYCDTEHSKIISLYPQYNLYELEANISINDYLLSYGYEIVETKDTANEQDYLELFHFVQRNNKLGSLSNLFKKVRDRLTVDSMTKPKFTESSSDLVFRFHKNYDNYLLEYGDKTKRTIKIDYRNFKSGDWLEYFVYFSLKENEGLNPIMGVKIINNEGVENEIDVIVMKNYRLFLISCKTGKKDNQFDLYQLETLRNITSGTFGKGIFVTANKHSDKFLHRAKELSINVINIQNNLKIDL